MVRLPGFSLLLLQMETLSSHTVIYRLYCHALSWGVSLLHQVFCKTFLFYLRKLVTHARLVASGLLNDRVGLCCTYAEDQSALQHPLHDFGCLQPSWLSLARPLLFFSTFNTFVFRSAMKAADKVPKVVICSCNKRKLEKDPEVLCVILADCIDPEN